MKNKIVWPTLALFAVALVAYLFLGREPRKSHENAAPSLVKQADRGQEEAAKNIPLPLPTAVEVTKSTDVAAQRSVATAGSEMAEHSANIARSIEITYGKAMRGLGLSETEREMLRKFLVEKGEVSFMAQDVAVATPGRTADEVAAAVIGARAQVDDEMRKYFGDEKYLRIQLLQDGVTYLSMERTLLEPALVNRGLPSLDPVQLVKLATVMVETHGAGLESIPPKRTDPATGLTDRDLPALEKASGFLSRDQVTVLQSVLVTRNSYSSYRN